MLLLLLPLQGPAALRLNYAERRGAMYLLFCAELPAPCSPAATRTEQCAGKVLDLVQLAERCMGITEQARGRPSMVQ
jgi:hypothetical protein